jgi:C1A family cysteine protease
VKKSRRNVIIAIIIALVIIGVGSFVVIKNKNASSSNSSRRDEASSDYNADEDLQGLVGTPEDNESVDKEAAAASGGSSFISSVVSETVNNPLTSDVEQVRKVLLPEAVQIGDGDIGAFYSNQDFTDVIPVDIDSFSEKEIPSEYDSRNVGGKCYVTEVEDQGYTSLCWTFAALGAVESDLLKHHADLKPEDIDLSEKHLAYYNLHKAQGSLNGTIDGDYRELVNRDEEPDAWLFDYDTGYIDCGGVTNFVISMLTAWKGPVAETGDDEFKSTYGAKYIFTDNADAPSDAYESLYHVQSVDQMPAKLSNNTLVKQMIMEHGAATIGINADSKYWKNHSSNNYSSFGGEKAETANHEVLIIGWDDDYSASNFGTAPEGDGAWLCKNSWGTSSGKEGCFYLSYYDETVDVSNAAAYEVAAPGDDNWYDNNYQSAGFLTNTVSCLDDSENMMRAYTNAQNPYGMLYEATGSQDLKAIGLMSIDLYQQYELDIYVNPDVKEEGIAFTDQDVPAISQKISAISAGYHTFELDDVVPLEKGDKFFILIRPATSLRLPFEEAEDMMGEPNYDEWRNLVGSIHNKYEASGNSYYISDDGLSMVKQDDKDFFVKAYTVNR